jgi:hypothetical protein
MQDSMGHSFCYDERDPRSRLTSKGRAATSQLPNSNPGVFQQTRVLGTATQTKTTHTALI